MVVSHPYGFLLKGRAIGGNGPFDGQVVDWYPFLRFVPHIYPSSRGSENDIGFV